MRLVGYQVPDGFGHIFRRAQSVHRDVIDYGLDDFLGKRIHSNRLGEQADDAATTSTEYVPGRVSGGRPADALAGHARPLRGRDEGPGPALLRPLPFRMAGP